MVFATHSLLSLYNCVYSQLSPCGQPVITDTPIIPIAAKSPANTNYRRSTEINSRRPSKRAFEKYKPRGLCSEFYGSRHFATQLLVSPRNDVWETSVGIPDMGSASDWLKILIQEHYWDLGSQAGISALVSQTLIRRETSDGIAKCRMVSQATTYLKLFYLCGR